MTLIRRRFWWPSLQRDVAEYVAACPTCAANKTSTSQPAGKLRPLPVPDRPWSHVALDFVTGLPPSQGMTTVLTIVDRFSKMAHFIPLPKLPDARETAEIVLQHVFRLHGLPKTSFQTEGPSFRPDSGRSSVG